MQVYQKNELENSLVLVQCSISLYPWKRWKNKDNQKLIDQNKFPRKNKSENHLKFFKNMWNCIKLVLLKICCLKLVFSFSYFSPENFYPLTPTTQFKNIVKYIRGRELTNNTLTFPSGSQLG